MKTKHLFFLLLFLFAFTPNYSQNIIRTQTSDSINYWAKKNTIGFDMNEIAFVNWSAGGNNAISGLIKGNFTREYKKGTTKWSNELIMRYGLNKQDGIEMRKTDDVFQFNSTLGYQNDTISHWYHSAKFNFLTQFTNGYAYPNTTLAISKPFAPSYTFLGVGAEYINQKEKLNMYFSPMTFKNTLVLDQRLANQGAFGVKGAEYDTNGNLIHEGRKSKTELGFLTTAKYTATVLKNINTENRLALYTDYLNNFGNIDVMWQLQTDMIVNEYIKANIGITLVYDDDVKTKKQIDNQQVILGPKVQLKEMMGIGVNYNF
ncbi:MAG: DUF3078 domain-containing protein [Flavobacterium sp.]